MTKGVSYVKLTNELEKTNRNLASRCRQVKIMKLTEAQEGKKYIIQQIETDDEELNAFLFSLGCYSGELITLVAKRRSGCTVSVKDGRYSIDNQLAEAIIV